MFSCGIIVAGVLGCLYPEGTAQLLWFGKFFLVAKVARVDLELEAWTRVFACVFFIFLFC